MNRASSKEEAERSTEAGFACEGWDDAAPKRLGIEVKKDLKMQLPICLTIPPKKCPTMGESKRRSNQDESSKAGFPLYREWARKGKRTLSEARDSIPRAAKIPGSLRARLRVVPRNRYPAQARCLFQIRQGGARGVSRIPDAGHADESAFNQAGGDFLLSCVTGGGRSR